MKHISKAQLNAGLNVKTVVDGCTAENCIKCKNNKKTLLNRFKNNFNLRSKCNNNHLLVRALSKLTFVYIINGTWNCGKTDNN